MKKNSPMIFILLLGGIGALFVFIAICSFIKQKQFYEIAIKTQAEVTQLIEKESKDSDGDYHLTYTPKVKFTTLNQEEIETISNLSSNPPRYKVGEQIEVFYNPDNPRQIQIDSLIDKWLLIFIFGLIGGIAVSFAVTLLIGYKQRQEMIAWLKTNGQSITAHFQEVRQNTHYKVNGRSPWQIVASWQNPLDQQIYLFESENLWFNPQEYIKTQDVVVLIDPNNPKKYYLDLSFLPSLA